MNKKSERFHTGTISKSILIKAKKQKVWSKISNIAGLPEWIDEFKKTVYLSRKKRGVGAIRKIITDEGKSIEEHVIAWKNGEYFTYIATEGLPLRAYVATLSIKPKSKNASLLTWKCYLNTKKMTLKQYHEFLKNMRIFYETSLKSLKKKLEN